MKKYFKTLPIGNFLHDKKQVLQGLRKVIMNRNVPGFYKKLSVAGGKRGGWKNVYVFEWNLGRGKNGG